MLKKLIVPFFLVALATPASAQGNKVIITGMPDGTVMRLVGMPALENCIKTTEGYTCPAKLSRDYGFITVVSGKAEFQANTKGMGRICALIFVDNKIQKQSCVELPKVADTKSVLVKF